MLEIQDLIAKLELFPIRYLALSYHSQQTYPSVCLIPDGLYLNQKFTTCIDKLKQLVLSTTNKQFELNKEFDAFELNKEFDAVETKVTLSFLSDRIHFVNRLKFYYGNKVVAHKLVNCTSIQRINKNV